MIIVGINDGHNASVCISKNKKIIFALSEERMTRKKNYFGMPQKTLDYALKNIVRIDEVDYFGIFRNSGGDFLVWLWTDPDPKDNFFLKKLVKPSLRRFGRKFIKIFAFLVSEKTMKRYYANYFSVPIEKIFLVNHHAAHAEAAVFNVDKDKDWLIFTCDAEGDLESGTVSSLKANKIKKLASIDRTHSLGYFYSYITEHLGMKPNQHEFKVMGLEPYVRKNTDQYKRVYKKISSLFLFEGLNFKSKISMVSSNYTRWLRRELFRERFDNIAAATQKTFEDVIINWVLNWIKNEGINNVALSGGSFMNVKACQKINELREVSSIYIVPSSGDETTVFGVCNYIFRKTTGSNLENLDHLYLGISFEENDIYEWSQNTDLSGYEVTNYGDQIEKKISELLIKGEVVARFNGKEEFGARALGNRSLLAHPSNPNTIALINKLIKDRDFWMPFTPSILEEDAGKYIKNRKNLLSPYMAITFDATKQGEIDFSAAIHPYDKTMRIQMVSKETNRSYHSLINRFKESSGISGILNTSFNLHGEPNVHSPDDALRTLANSGLNYLAIGNILIQKNY